MAVLPNVLTESVDAHLTWMRTRGLSPATITQRRRSLARLQSAVGPLLNVTENDLQLWQESLTGAPRYLANQAANCACFYAWAVDVARLIPENPARRLIRPKVQKGVPRPIAEERLGLAIAAAPPDVRCWLVLGAYAGLRAGEMSRLQRQSVLDTADTPVLIVDGKGGKQRIVPASPRVLFELRAYGMPSRGMIFRRRDGQPGAPTAARVSQLVNEHLHEIGIEDTGHAARHRFGTRAYQRSRDLRMVQELLGHSDPGSTAVYAAFAAEQAAAVVASLDPDEVGVTA